MSWFKKLMNLMFDDEPSETEETIDPALHKNEKTEPVKGRTVGRFQNHQNSSAARMVSRYPVEGKFRFPLIDDQEEIGRHTPARKQSYAKKQTGREGQETARYTRERQKENLSKEEPAKPPLKEEKTQPFKPSEIPSPIYGFGSRNGTNQVGSGQAGENRYSAQDSNSKFRPSEIPSPVYGFGGRDKSGQSPSKKTEERPKGGFMPSQVPSPIYGYRERKPDTIVNPGLWKLSEIQKKKMPDPALMEELLKEPVSGKEPVILSEEEGRNLPVAQEKMEDPIEEPIPQMQMKKEPVLLIDEFRKETIEPAQAELLPEPQLELPAEPSEARGNELHVAQLPGDEVIFELPPERMDLKEPEDEQIEQVQVVAEVEEPTALEPEEEEASAVKNRTVTDQEDANLIAEPALPEPSLKEEVVTRREPEKKPGGSYIPFNVLMLKKDRKSTANHTGDKKTPSPVETKATVNEVTPISAEEADLSFPPLELLQNPPVQEEDDSLWMEEQRDLLQLTLDNFNVNAKVVNMTKGPSVTRLEVQPAPGVKVNKITNLSDDIKLSLSAKDIRIEAPIPGKNTIGIEVPNLYSQPVFLREILQTEEFRNSSSPLTVALGLDLSGDPIVTDLQKMPHGLIAGATGSGKSVCINSILISLMYKASPEDVRLLLVDPKMVELAPYNAIPHLVTPVITDPKEATTALKWTVEEMERRYEAFARHGVRDIKRFNDKMKREQLYANKMPYIVVVIDELADLMMVSPQDVEEAICRIAQKARACGIHLLVATQRPSVDVITGLIKANIPTRTAFAVSSAVDSRTIIDMSGAERLLGRGDMLFLENGSSKAVRIQGNFVSDDEIERVTAFVKEQHSTNYLFSREELIQSNQTVEQEDDLFEEACYYVLDMGAASSSSIQRRFRVGYNRAARLVEMMEAFGLVSEAMGSKPRTVLMTNEEFQSKLYSEAEV
ncbi:DNA segregation ATPase FtsK/SpoIIIE, S-DNA-T family [Fictibacillus enclensis]|uniref:Cell division protein FtsK n=1 Tax=Fictibacillus enclensis TaxID=1017270 RepID=A0A0V8J9L9_9BACL|nr:DNA translocase FtsK [Fictibacillus enclensis]KSU83620.1 cell division protein FtsK [Fictibacillus enclensis]SCC18529.1 DNA segregation ATPase FtsK/SpoIIIE, S-DNA-T family [Fictibacillus enclensis]